MRIIAINGSPAGAAGNTNVIVNSFFKGAKDAGAQTQNIFLTDKEIQYCKGCHSCWFKTPGSCVIKDDMAGILSSMAGVNLIILASPVYFNNISGNLKVFMDRLTVIGNPHTAKKNIKDDQTTTQISNTTPSLLMISTCGFPDRTQFDVISHWIKRVAVMMQAKLLGEIYTPQGRLLSNPPQESRDAINAYLQTIENAGKEIAQNGMLSKECEGLLNKGFV